jgi:hypothetical protein
VEVVQRLKINRDIKFFIDVNAAQSTKYTLCRFHRIEASGADKTICTGDDKSRIHTDPRQDSRLLKQYALSPARCADERKGEGMLLLIILIILIFGFGYGGYRAGPGWGYYGGGGLSLILTIVLILLLLKVI